MPKKACLFLILFIWTVSSKAELTVMTLNAEWLWTPYDGKVDGSKYNRGDMGKGSYLKEITFYASIVKHNNIDILAISEIENKFVADDIANKLGNKWKAYFVQGRDTATGQDVAIISHLAPVNGSMTSFGFPCGKAPKAKKKKCLSKVIGASFKLPGNDASTISVITAHFLSKRNENKKKRLRRQSQAHALLKAISRGTAQFSSKTQVKQIVLGDFNDTYNSQVIRTIREAGRLKGALDCPGSQPSAAKRRLRAIDHILFRGFNCVSEYAVETTGFSDHDAVVMKLK